MIKLYEKQREILEQVKNGSIIRCGTATGKTYMSLTYYLENYYPTKLIVFAPPSKAYSGDWETSLKRISADKPLPEMEVISYGSVVKKLAYLVSHKEEFVVIFDEIHYLKNPTSQRGKACAGISKRAKAWIGLSATPASKVEEHANYFIMWNAIRNKTSFFREFVRQELAQGYNRSYPKIVGYKNLDTFKKVCNEHFTSAITVNDIVELPPIIHDYVTFNISREYKQTKRDRIYNGEPLDTHAKLCARLRMIVNTRDKLEYLLFKVEQLKELKENVIIFYNFKSEFEAISKLIKPDYVINGSIKNYPKKEEFNKIKSTVTLVQMQSGSAGIELQYANNVIYYSPTYSYQDFMQSLGRCYRPGQEKKLIILKFRTVETIEEDIWDVLEKKQDFVEKDYDRV